MISASDPDAEAGAQKWLAEAVKSKTDRKETADLLLQTWWRLSENKPFTDGLPEEEARRAGWRQSAQGKEIEIGWLARQGPRPARYQARTAVELGL
jgi:hypothetical protein